MTLLAAFQVLLHRYTGQDDIAVGTPIAGRGRTELEGLIGFFVNTLVLRTDLSGNPTLPRAARTGARDGAGRLRASGPALREAGRGARPQPRPEPQSAVPGDVRAAERAWTPRSRSTASRRAVCRWQAHSAKFDLTLSVRESDARVCMAVGVCDRSVRCLHHRAHGAAFRNAAGGDRRRPRSSRSAQLPLLTESERHQLLVEWNDTAADYPQDRCIHQLFEEQVGTHAGSGGRRLRGSAAHLPELNAARQSAGAPPRQLGVGPDVLVGLCMERSLELIVGLLGILKAGGAYVPLDPTYPKERYGFMLADANASVANLRSKSAPDDLPTPATRSVYLTSDDRRTLHEGQPACDVAPDKIWPRMLSTLPVRPASQRRRDPHRACRELPIRRCSARHV